MHVKRNHHRSSYVQIPNTIARHGSLSLEAVGLLTRLLSLPDGAGATVEKVAARVSNGRRSVAKAMNELIGAGYVKRVRVQDPGTGRWVTITTVMDAPEPSLSPADRSPAVGLPSGQAVGGSPIGRKTEEEKNTSSLNQPQGLAPLAPEGAEKGGEEGALLRKISREMAREGRRVLERLSLHKSLPLTDQEIARLVPKVVPWLREDYRSEEILQCLTAALPEQIDSVPGLIAHRLRHFTPVRVTPQQPSKPVARAHCEVCQVIFPIGHQGGVCRACKAEMGHAAPFFAA